MPVQTEGHLTKEDLVSILSRIFTNWKTTVGGTAVGAVAMAMIALVMNQAGCNFSNVQWLEVLALAFAGPTTVGAMSTDSGKTV